MLTPGLTLIAQPWIRHRGGMRFTAAALALLLLASLSFPPDLRHGWWLLLMPIVAILSASSAYILNSILFLEREGDLSSGYPRRLFVLPLPTTTLVFWPMLLDLAIVSALWLLASVVIPYIPFPLPKILPILVLAAAVSWLQAMVWCPFGAGWYRLVVCAIVYNVLVMPPLVAQDVMKLVVPWELLMVVYLLGAWAVAYWAVSRARRGDVWMPRLPGAKVAEVASNALPRRRGFGSPASAQLWFEARCHRWILPLMTFCFLGVFGVVLTFTPLEAGRPGLVTPYLFGLAAASPILLAPTVGVKSGRFEPFWRSSERSIGFAATRPMTTQSLVVAKFRNAWTSVLVTWTVVAVLVVGAIVVSGGRSRAVELARTAAGHYDGRSVWLMVGLALIVAPTLTWNSLTSGLPASLCGRRWIAEAYSWTFAASMMAAAFPAVWFVGHPESIPTLIRSFPWFVVALAPLKATAAVVGFRKAIARGLIDGGYMAAAAAIWLAIALCTAGLVRVAIAPFSPPFSGYWILGAGAVISPLARFALAPLALDWNRHR